MEWFLQMILFDLDLFIPGAGDKTTL